MTSKITSTATSTVIGAGSNDSAFTIGQDGSVNGGQLAGLRNRIINGGMQVGQRSPATLSSAAYQFGQADRWQFICAGGTGVSGSLINATSGSFSSGFCAGTGSASWTNGQFFARQRIEARNVADLNSKTVTVSAKVYQDTGVTRTFRIALVKATAGVDNWGSQIDIGTPADSVVGPAVATTISATFTLGATDANNGIAVLIYDSTVNTVVTKAYLVGDVQLELGSVATPFEQRPYGMELALCQRYAKTIITGANIGSGLGITTTTAELYCSDTLNMRATPSIEGTYTVQARYTGGIYLASVVTPSAGQISLTHAANSVAAGQGMRAYVASGTLLLTSELS